MKNKKGIPDQTLKPCDSDSPLAKWSSFVRSLNDGGTLFHVFSFESLLAPFGISYDLQMTSFEMA